MLITAELDNKSMKPYCIILFLSIYETFYNKKL